MTFDEFRSKMPTFEEVGYKEYGDGSLGAITFSPSIMRLEWIRQLACDDVPDTHERQLAWLDRVAQIMGSADWRDISGTRWEAACLVAIADITRACGVMSSAIAHYRDAIHVGYGGDGMGAWVAVQRLEELGEDPWA